jgi:hypothetical protein
MRQRKFLHVLYILSFLFLNVSFNQTNFAQDETVYRVITDKEELKSVVPKSFYFAGLSADTQMRNAAAALIGEKRYLIAGLVDTSGYSTEISGVYEGFFITDSPVKFGDKTLETGAYGFGFKKENEVNVFDLSSKQILTAATTNDAEMRRPRPLMMQTDANGIRLYKGRNYVLISPK